MSLSILDENEDGTSYAPLNTPIDGDRDYRELTGFYPGEQAPPGMQLDAYDPPGGYFAWYMAGLLGFGLWWALRNPTGELGAHVRGGRIVPPKR
jgi:hypothetical protein